MKEGIWNGYTVWGGLGSGIKYVVDFNRSGIKMIEPDDKVMAQIAEADSIVNSYQEPLGKERAIVLFYRADNPWTGYDDFNLFNKVLKKTPPDGCYAVTVQDAR